MRDKDRLTQETGTQTKYTREAGMIGHRQHKSVQGRDKSAEGHKRTGSGNLKCEERGVLK